MDLLRSTGAYDRRAIMALAHDRCRAAGNAWTFQACLQWAWASAKNERRLLAAGRTAELRRLRDMRAHHLACLRARSIGARAA